MVRPDRGGGLTRFAEHSPPHPPQRLGVGELGGCALRRDQRAYGAFLSASDDKGEYVQDRPVYPCDLIGSMYELLGIDPDGNLPHPMGQAVRVTPSPDEVVEMGGRLKELT